MTDTIEAEVIQPVKRSRGRPAGKKTGNKASVRRRISKVLDLRARGLSVAEIGKATDLGRTRVKDILREFRPVFTELENNEKYQHVRRDLLSATELGLLKSLNDPEKISKSTLNGTAYAFKQVFDARRLESNLSTSNTSVQQISVSINPSLDTER